MLNKAKFPVVLSYAVDQSVTLYRVKSAFRKSGLFPIDRYAIDETQLVKTHLEPSSVTSPESETAVASATPASSQPQVRHLCFNDYATNMVKIKSFC